MQIDAAPGTRCRHRSGWAVDRAASSAPATTSGWPTSSPQNVTRIDVATAAHALDRRRGRADRDRRPRQDASGWPRSTPGTSSGSTPAPRTTSRFDLGAPVHGLAVVDGHLWVASGAFAVDQPSRWDPARRAAATLPGQFERRRPGRRLRPDAYHAERIVYDGLLAYHYSQADPQVLVPDLATSVPEPTDGGRTYTFNLRRGIRYSTGVEVRASDFVRGVRARAASRPAARPDFYAGIVGGQACIDDPDVLRPEPGRRGGRRRGPGDVPPRGAGPAVPPQADAPRRPGAAGHAAGHGSPRRCPAPGPTGSPPTAGARRFTLTRNPYFQRVVGRRAAGRLPRRASPGQGGRRPARRRTPCEQGRADLAELTLAGLDGSLARCGARRRAQGRGAEPAPPTARAGHRVRRPQLLRPPVRRPPGTPGPQLRGRPHEGGRAPGWAVGGRPRPASSCHRACRRTGRYCPYTTGPPGRHLPRPRPRPGRAPSCGRPAPRA